MADRLQFPFVLTLQDSLTAYENKAEKSTVAWYQSAVGALMWPALCILAKIWLIQWEHPDVFAATLDLYISN